MPKKNFMSYGDSETIFSEYADKINNMIFTGTKAEWAALSDSDKAKYRQVNITDDEITTVSETSITLSHTDNTDDDSTLHLEKIGNIVIASFFKNGSISGTLKTNWATIGTIPEGYRPTRSIYTTIAHANQHNVTVGLQIQRTGRISQYNYTTGNLGYERSVNLVWKTA